MTLDALIARVRRRMTWRHAAPWLIRGLAAGMVAGAVLLLIARAIPVPHAPVWALVAGLALLGAGAGIAWLTRPNVAAALRGADRLLSLRDRLSTAWEFAHLDAPILHLQRSELAAMAGHLDLSRTLPVRPRRREAVAPTAGVALLLVALLVPYPHTHAAAPPIATHSRSARAAARLATATRAASGLPPATLAALPKAEKLRQAQIARILARLQRELAAAHTQAQALKAIARAQDALNQLANAGVGAQRAALNALASALGQSPTTRRLAAALRNGDPAAVQRALSTLMSQLAHMTAAQRASLARNVQAAANAAASDPALSSALQNAATALAQGNTSDTRAALQQAGQQAAADQARGAQQSALDRANAALDNARNDVSGLSNPGSSAPPAGATNKGASQSSGQAQTGKGSGKGQAGTGSGQGQAGKGSSKGHNAGSTAGTGQGKGSGAGTGQGGGQGNPNGQGGRGSRGNGQGNGTGSGAGGSGQGAGSGAGGSGQGQGGGAGGSGQGGGLGGGGARGGNANGARGSNAQGSRVYIPGPQGAGPTSQSTGTQAQPARGSLQPWRSVLPSYERGARAGIQSGTVPSNQAPLVTQYFDELDRLRTSGQ